MTADDRTTALWAYQGMRLDNNGKSYYLWQDAFDLDDEATDRAHHSFDKNITSGAQPGSLYEVTLVKEGTSVLTSGDNRPRFKGQHESEDKRIEWRVLHDAAEARKRMDKEAKNVDDDLERALKVIKERMHNARNKHERAAILGVVIARITLY